MAPPRGPDRETLILPFAIAPHQLSRSRAVFFCLALLLFSHLSPSIALGNKTPSGSSSFQAAKKSFQAGDYEQALSLFKKAQKAGLDKPSLYYNIGVCSYKIGLYEEATKAFLQTATFPKMAALAYYNLAVVAEKQADLDAALSWLQKSIASAAEDDEKLLLLAQTALSRIQSKHEQAEQWTRFAALGIGYDDNVSIEANDDLELTSEEGDSFTDAMAFFRSPLFGKAASQGRFLQGSMSFRDYTDLDDYDVGILQVDGRYRIRAGGFHIEGGGGYSYLYWDDDSYSQSPLFSLQAKRSLSETSSYRLRYAAKYVHILNSSYDYLQGWQQRATMEFLHRSERYRLLVGYSLEVNDRDDRDLSPRRHLLSAQLGLYPVDRLTLTLTASYRDSYYDQAGSSDRNEDRYEASLLCTYTLSPKWEVRGSYSHTINISSSPLYDYRRSVTSIAVGYSF